MTAPDLAMDSRHRAIVLVVASTILLLALFLARKLA